MKSVHLVCNAHLDPIWLWEWEEGAAEAVSTFRVAADLCEEFDSFVFNHNEVILYRWVEEYEPALFRRIQELVRRGKWHIMGGWYLQPDCNMPSGESFVRQILLGRRYFREKFGVTPTTAINFDPFGHTRGLVQILARSGYDSYLFCRPGQKECPLPADEFIWEGYDGSRVMGHRALHGYNTARGQARAKVRRALETAGDKDCIAVLWGVGNHGGGPSRVDLERLEDFIRETPGTRIRHSTPEAYFRELSKRAAKLPVHRGDMNPWAVGCYTSQIRVKQHHRRLENELYATEKMLAAAWCTAGQSYPAAELDDVMRDLATCEFHDVLPGSSIQPAEEAALRMMDRSLETLSRLKARAFFALAQSQRKAPDGQVPVLVYNPHPFPVRTLVECEFNLPDQNWGTTFTQVTACRNGRPLPTQLEQESCNVTLDWRKRAVFEAELAPSQMNRFDCRTEVVPSRPRPRQTVRNGRIVFRGEGMRVVINARTGLMDSYRVGGVEQVRPGACQPIVMHDDADPWGMRVQSFRKLAGRFRLLSPERGARFSGLPGERLPSVRIIEDGPVRTVVEALFGYSDSFICQRYKLAKRGAEIEIETRVFWNEKDRMLKLTVPTPDRAAECRGQVAFGADVLPAGGREAVAQKWVAVVSPHRGNALTCINDGTYGLDFKDGELRLSLLRSAAHSAHPIHDRPLLPPGRFTPRMEQGERVFRFWLNAGPAGARLAAVDREAAARNERPMALSFFPAGGGKPARPLAILSDPVVQVPAIKKAERGSAIVLRLFEPTGRQRTTTVSLPFARMRRRVTLGGFEVRTLRIDLRKRTWAEVDLTENPVRTTG